MEKSEESDRSVYFAINRLKTKKRKWVGFKFCMAKSAYMDRDTPRWHQRTNRKRVPEAGVSYYIDPVVPAEQETETSAPDQTLADRFLLLFVTDSDIYNRQLFCLYLGVWNTFWFEFNMCVTS